MWPQGPPIAAYDTFAQQQQQQQQQQPGQNDTMSRDLGGYNASGMMANFLNGVRGAGGVPRAQQGLGGPPSQQQQAQQQQQQQRQQNNIFDILGQQMQADPARGQAAQYVGGYDPNLGGGALYGQMPSFAMANAGGHMVSPRPNPTSAGMTMLDLQQQAGVMDGSAAAAAAANNSMMIDDMGNVVLGGTSAISAHHQFQKSFMSKDDRAKANRDRNREHARNTRLRKKAFVEKLKENVDMLVEKVQQLQGELDLEKAKPKGSMSEGMLKAQSDQLQSFLDMRAGGVVDRVKWLEVVEEGFVMKLPITPYRNFPETQISGTQRVIRGVDGLIVDTASLHCMAESIGSYQGMDPACKRVELRFLMAHDEKKFFGKGMLCKWIGETTNAVTCGALSECKIVGVAICSFGGDGRFKGIDFYFDVMAFVQQLRMSSRLPIFHTVPNIHERALARSVADEAYLVVGALDPYAVQHANEHWRSLCSEEGKELEESAAAPTASEESASSPLGRPVLDLICGDKSSTHETELLKNGLENKRCASCMLHLPSEKVVYTQCLPLYNGENVEMYMIILRRISSAAAVEVRQSSSGQESESGGLISHVEGGLISHVESETSASGV